MSSLDLGTQKRLPADDPARYVFHPREKEYCLYHSLARISRYVTFFDERKNMVQKIHACAAYMLALLHKAALPLLSMRLSQSTTLPSYIPSTFWIAAKPSGKLNIFGF